MVTVVQTGAQGGDVCAGGQCFIATTVACCQAPQFPLMCPPILSEALLPEEFSGAMTMANAVLMKRKQDNDGCFVISLFFGPGFGIVFTVGASINDCQAVQALQNQCFATWQSKGITVAVEHCCEDFKLNITVPAGIPKAKRPEANQTVIVQEEKKGSSATDAAMAMMMMQQAQMGNMAMMNQQNQMNMQNQQMMMNQQNQQSMNNQMMMNNQNQNQQNQMVQNQMLLNN
eukprot:TRINITY_DN12360_c0_g1_i1.p1 TRINITY_DN12360_c0_g1~~TRINITY_DN12360_c0_g1_i1.p1  ORF type:complete len:230 (+),score=44.24 TRINITY_DN12360_c0_g1_i1:84-773(+)